MDSNLTYSSSCQIIDPATLFTDGYELTNQTIIESQEYLGSFTPNENRVEFYIYDANKAIIQSNYDFQGWRIEENPNPSSSFNAQSATTTVQSSELILDPENAVISSSIFVYKEAILSDIGILPGLDAVVEVKTFKSASYDCILDTFSTKLLTCDFAEAKLINSLNDAVE